MDELVRWLGEQLDEDERIAVSGESWTAFDESTQGTRRVDVDHSIERVVACTRSWRGEHIAAWDPARVLREVDAKRRTLSRMGRVLELGWDYYENSTVIDLARETLVDLAAVYKDRPGYAEAIASAG